MTRIINRKTIEIYDYPDADSSVWRDDYILEYYKKILIDLLLKIQDDYPGLLGSEHLTREGLYHFYYGHLVPEENFDLPEILSLHSPEIASDNLKEEIIQLDITPFQINEKSENKKPAKINEKKAHASITKTTPFNIIYADIRNAPNSRLTYNDIIVNTEHFGFVETQLYKMNLIDHQYNFINDHGNIKLLAQVLHILFDRGYFRLFLTKKHSSRQEIQKRTIVRYLQKRYNLETLQKTFCNIASDKIGLQKLLKKNTWVNKLPFCNI
jgi:hypothetical protein